MFVDFLENSYASFMKCFIACFQIILSNSSFFCRHKILAVCLSDMENITAAEDTGYRHSQKQKDLFSFLGGEFN